VQPLLKLADCAVRITVVKQAGSQLGANGKRLGLNLQRLSIVTGGFLELMGSFVEVSDLDEQITIVGIVFQFREERLRLLVGPFVSCHRG